MGISQHEYMRLSDLRPGQRFQLFRTGEKYVMTGICTPSRRFLVIPEWPWDKPFPPTLAWNCKVKYVAKPEDSEYVKYMQEQGEMV